MARPGQVTGISVILTEPGSAALREEVRRRIEALAPGLKAYSVRELADSVTEIQLAKGMAWLTSTIALLIGSFGMMNTMLMSVHERTREIGILRAVGWRVERVIRMVLLEAVLLSMIGAFCGCVAAVVLLKVLTRVPAVSGFIDGHIDPLLLGYGFLIAIGVGLLGGIIPARRATRMMPTEALRHE
jgi:putative ABC transport system permease protein